MARLDPFIDLLFREKADLLLLETGEPAVLNTGDQARPAMQRPLSTAQIASACAELAPPHLRETFSVFEASSFEYAAPGGRVRVQVDPKAEGVRASFAPVAAQPKAQRARSRAIELPPDVGAAPAAPAKAALAALTLVPAQAAVSAQPPAAAPKPVTVRASAADAASAMHELLDLAIEQKASDLHLTTDFNPCLRVDGDIVPIEGYGPISDERLREMLFSIAPPQNREQWLATKDTDFAHETAGARFRVNLFAERSGIGAVLRRIPTTVMTAAEMGLSQQLLDLCFLHKGLVLVTGPTGSGKSTTLAALVDHVNKNRDDHIITIEDPIEFVHKHQRCLVHQREVGVHTQGFKAALRAALREDPDVVLVGELRDLETISIALETAETGHLVFGTLHTNTAPSTVDRIIDQFPADRQAQVRTMMSESLKAVVAQTLVKKIGGGRAAAQEVLLVNSAISNLIREGKTFQIPSIMQTQRNAGMVTLNDALYDLVKRKVVTAEDALSKAIARAELKAMLDRLAATPQAEPLKSR
jgi:twitching motility protein PilT